MDVTQMLAEQEDAAQQDLKVALDTGEDSGLKLAPLAVLAFLGAKVALPIVCSFVSRELWERYNRIRTHAQASEARAELAATATGQANPDEDSVVGPVVESLLEEGVSAEVADRVVRQAYIRIREQMGSGSAG
jgi:hypothetical protein